MNKTINNNILSRIVNSIFILLSIFLISACSSGGGGSTPVPDVDMSGYYEGTATIDALNITDLQVVTDNSQLIITSVATDLLYVATVTSISGNDFTASVRIYRNGLFERTATVAGAATAGSSITGTISGSGAYTSGTFSLTYSLLNGRTPRVFGMSTLWQDSSPRTANMEFDSNTVMYVTLDNTSSSTITQCYVNGASLVDVNTEQPGRIRSFSDNFENCTDTAVNNTAVQGFMTTFDDVGTDDQLLFVIFSDNNAQISILDLISP